MRKDYTHVLYHGNCYDGFGAAFAAWMALGNAAVYEPVLHGQDPPEFPPGTKLLIWDFTFPREVLLDLRDRLMRTRSDPLYVIDHHKTAQEDLAGLPFAEFDLEHSGAYLTWRHFFGEPAVPEFIRYLEDRDLWRFHLPDSKGVSQALRAYPFDFEVWRTLSVQQLREEGPVVQRLTDQLVANMCDHARLLTIAGYRVPVANATVFFSEVGDELCRRFPEAPFAAYYLDRADGKRQWGFRSRNGFDTSVVAKGLGGGGHPAASGFQEPIPFTSHDVVQLAEG